MPTFSAPKSVSLTALVGGDDRVREAHREAVNAALSELERYTQARIGGNYAAELTGRFIAAKFEHDTARPVDGYAAPQLHTHAVVFNLTERENGVTRSLQPRGLFETQQFATAVYQSHLTYRLRELGYEIEPGRSGAPEIKGYTQEYLDASSPRRQQIVEAVERSGFQGHEAAEIAAHSTRDRKEILSPSEVLAAHRQLAADHGNQAERIISESRERAQGQTQAHTPDATQLRAQEAVSYARDRSYEREAVTDERDIFRDALRRGMGETTYGQVRRVFEGRLEAGEFQQVSSSKHASGNQYTTLDTIRAEMDLVRTMRDGQNSVTPIMPKEQAVAQSATREFLNPAQRTAVEEILTSRDRIHGLQGLAGSGKTNTLETIREGAERNGYAVEGFAPTSRAAGQLRDAGIPADTLQGYLARGGREQIAGDPTAAISTCSTSLPFRAPSRCASSSKRLDRRTACCWSEILGSIRASKPASPSSSCSRLECGPPGSTRSCARKTPNCSGRWNTWLRTRPRPVLIFSSNRAASPSWPIRSNESRPSLRTTRPIQITP